MFFNTWYWHVKNNDISPTFDYVMRFFTQWRIPLLFFISGAGVSFALKSRNPKQFLLERTLRLMVPLIFGMFVIVVPQLYFERVQQEFFTGNILQFYPKVLELKPYPSGNFSWHHLWFLLYLFFYCVICLPLFLWIKSEKGKTLQTKLTKVMSHKYGVFVVSIWFSIIYWTLSSYGGIQNFVSDWFNHAVSISFFILGYIVGSQNQMWLNAEVNRKTYLAISLCLTTTLYIVYWLPFSLVKGDLSLTHLIIYGLLKMLNLWSIILSVCGYAKHYLNFSNNFLQYANDAILPFYILHQTITITVGYYIAYWNLHILLKFSILVIMTFGGCWVIYEFSIKPFTSARYLFGLKPLKHVEKPEFLRRIILSFGAILSIILMLYVLFITREKRKTIALYPLSGRFVLNGNLDDPIWQNAYMEKDFVTSGPYQGKRPILKTRFYLTHDHENLYAGFICFENDSAKISDTSAKSDSPGNDDAVSFCLNTYNSKNETCFFLVNPKNVKTDGTLNFFDGSPEMKTNLVWESATAKKRYGWTAEMKIPLKQFLTTDINNMYMKFKAVRNIAHLNQEVIYPKMYKGSQLHSVLLQKIQLVNANYQ